MGFRWHSPDVIVTAKCDANVRLVALAAHQAIRLERITFTASTTHDRFQREGDN